MSKFCVVLAGHDKVTDGSRTNTCGRKLKAHHYKHKLQKTKNLPKTWAFNGKSLKISDKKKGKNNILDFEDFEDFRGKKEQKYCS